MLPRLTTILIIVVGVVTLSLFFSRPKLYRQEFKAYFKNGQALRNGAEVRVAGIPSGIVKSVQIRPDHRDAPVEVVFEVQTTYQLPIPEDSIVRLGTGSILGNNFTLRLTFPRRTDPRHLNTQCCEQRHHHRGCPNRVVS
jgi:ABC-type transporter Mla subunit MlaD